MTNLIIVAAVTAAALLAGAGALHAIPRLGAAGRKLGDSFGRAPLLDLIVTFFLIAPLVVGPIVAGWWGIVAALVGQIVALQTWVFLHELAHPAARRGPRIVKTMNRIVGRWRNHAAVWATATVVPLFWLVRLAQIFVYPLLTLLIGLPRYKAADWVNVSRHKFEGLVGHDLIWCLYCDWMTGVWSLGSEMLRNVESFWCPIRFASGKKCENCKLDFPDVVGDWVAADAGMKEVTEVLEEKYAGRKERSWFGHPARLTVEGRDVKD
ncbi:MAG: hypothetical protein EA376_08355 [Phycisphaeraceae bacterium]|nr:MAG: hypothetical protein EA376_08355 [Phycisphaeraceae bacterium]